MKKKVLALIIVIPVILLVAYLLKNLISRYILVPMLYASRIGSILFEAIPQYFWWGIFIFVLGVVAIRSLFVGRRPKSIDVEIPNEERMSRARLWSRWIEMSHRGNYSKWMLSRHFADLVTNVLVYHERQSLERIQNRIINDEDIVPPNIGKYLKVGLNIPSFRHYSEYLGDKSWFHLRFINRISNYLKSVLRRRESLYDSNKQATGSTLTASSTLPDGSSLPPTLLQIDPEVIVHFLESKIPTGGSV